MDKKEGFSAEKRHIIQQLKDFNIFKNAVMISFPYNVRFLGGVLIAFVLNWKNVENTIEVMIDDSISPLLL